MKKLTRTTFAVATCFSLSTAAVAHAQATDLSIAQPAGSSVIEKASSPADPVDDGQDPDGSTTQDTINSPAGQLVMLFASIVSLVLAVVPLIAPYLPAFQNFLPR